VRPHDAPEANDRPRWERSHSSPRSEPAARWCVTTVVGPSTRVGDRHGGEGSLGAVASEVSGESQGPDLNRR
jgi:hypothetical protein